MANVFISHRGADKSAAERLGSDLRDCGHDVWLDSWSIEIGDSIIQQINNGLSMTDFLILCYSDTLSASPWMDREWMSALARQLNGVGVRVLPVLLTGGSVPPILADVKYADLVTDWKDGVEAICKALG